MCRKSHSLRSANLYWQHLEDVHWRKPKVGSYWFWGFMRNTKRIVEVAEQKGIDIKIDTIISKDGTKKEIKIEVKTDNN